METAPGPYRTNAIELWPLDGVGKSIRGEPAAGRRFAPWRFPTYAWAPETPPTHHDREPTMQPLAAPKSSSSMILEHEALLPARARQFLERAVHLGLVDRADRA